MFSQSSSAINTTLVRLPVICIGVCDFAVSSINLYKFALALLAVKVVMVSPSSIIFINGTIKRTFCQSRLLRIYASLCKLVAIATKIATIAKNPRNYYANE
jgi:hypothetical protein